MTTLRQALVQQGTGIKNLAKAYVTAWGEIGHGVKKDANNPHFGNDYATLGASLALVKPIFAKHGLALLQAPGEIVGDQLCIMGLLIHESGESVSFKTMVPLGDKPTAQKAGSATTYGRRYQVHAISGIAPVDDDGEAASESPKPREKKTKEPNYAEGVSELIAAIETFAGTPEELEKTLRPRVEELADAKVNEVYVARRRALKVKK